MEIVSYVKSVASVVGLVVTIAAAVFIGSTQMAPAQAATSDAPLANESDAAAASILYVPLVVNDVNPALATRIGYGTTLSNVGQYQKVRNLNAGWYVNWYASGNPSTPAGIEYVQMLRLHQKVTCGSRVTPDRTTCPYVQPYAYEFGLDGNTDQATITSITNQRPGSLWLIGNECDRKDWVGDGQDEILPALYAEAYHEAYNWIKTADSTAKVAICGVIQPTDLRLQYLTIVWDTYKQKYGVDMPVDVWNTHAFIIREKADEWGAEIPPGITATQGAYVNQDCIGGQFCAHVDMPTFDKQIRAFRTWMKDRGQQNKPLIVTEYGVLYYWLPDDDVRVFMLKTFDYFLTTKDCALSGVDDCRLVQRWAWFSLDDLNGDEGFHPAGALFDEDTNTISETGELYRQYVTDNAAELAAYEP